jgi:hypothetical protein
MDLTQERIDEALECADRMAKNEYLANTSLFVLLAAAYRAEKERAELLERQYDSML